MENKEAIRYTIIFSDGSEVAFQVGVNGVADIYEPDPRETNGACYIAVTLENGTTTRYMNVTYIVTNKKD